MPQQRKHRVGAQRGDPLEYGYPKNRTVINLAPADLRKYGSAFDLSIRLRILVPRENSNEAAALEGLNVISVPSIAEAVGFLSGQHPPQPVSIDMDAVFSAQSQYDYDFADVRGREHAKRAPVTTAAGVHNVLVIAASDG